MFQWAFNNVILSESEIGHVVSMIELDTGSENLDQWFSGIRRHGLSAYLMKALEIVGAGKAVSVEQEILSSQLTEALSDSEVSANDAIQVPIKAGPSADGGH